jgi:hypothetical protein
VKNSNKQKQRKKQKKQTGRREKFLVVLDHCSSGPGIRD